MIKILSIDGGGIRGIIPALLLAELERHSGKRISDIFDLISGTSTGGIIALGLTVPMPDGAPGFTARALAEMYRRDGARIFSRPWHYRVMSLRGLSAAKYPPAGIEAVLKQYLGATCLRHASTDILIPAVDIERSRTVWFKSREAKADPVNDYLMVDVARATSAAPTFFPPHRLGYNEFPPYAFIDGGLGANNPAPCAYAETQRLGPQEALLISIGTGSPERMIRYEDARDFGAASWLSPVLNLAFSAPAGVADYICDRLLNHPGKPQRYWRVQPSLPEQHVRIDDFSPENLEGLAVCADRYIEANRSQFDSIVAAIA